MKTDRICPSCQKPLPEGTPQGLCPECLMKAGLGSTAPNPGGVPKFVPPSPADLARLFPQLEILELIGQGGMGAVYKARQPVLDRLVALKILPPESTTDPGFAERFSREARALAKLNHPNIVSIYDFGKVSGLHYFLMEFVDGPNLRQVERSGRLSSREALRIVTQMCDALQFAHEEGIIHRDIKPENVMVDKRGRVKITDFGIAKLLGLHPEAQQLTGAKDVMGTPHYMAPEQLEKPQTVDHRADIYSLGVVFYELLTGELPIGKFAPPSRKVEVDVRLDEVVLHTLEKEPDRRYQHASEVKTDVETITRPPGAAAPQPGADSLELAKSEDARRQVRGPALGLMVAAMLNWLGIPFIMLIAAYWSSQLGTQKSASFVWLPLSALLLSSVLLVAALKMKRLQAYWLAVIGSFLAIIVTPGNLVGLPVGIWALVVLSQRHVRNAFGKDHLLPLAPIPPSAASNPGWKIAAAIVAAIMLFLAIPVGGMLLALVLPALSKARVQAQRVQLQQEVILHRLNSSNRSQALDLDTFQVLNLSQFSSPTSDKDQLEWLRKQGADLFLDKVDGRLSLLTLSSNPLTLTPVANDAWAKNRVTQETPAAENPFEETITREDWVAYVLPTSAEPPLTLAFQTANGGKGLLQITSFGENPTHVRLRYFIRSNRNADSRSGSDGPR